VFTLLYTVSNNELGIKTTSLIDTEANSYTFVNTKFAKTIERFLDVKLTKLKDLYKVQGFDERQATSITQYLELALVID
jgi:hypothetical protein